VNTVSDKVVKH